MLQPARIPEFERVCEKLHREFEQLFKLARWQGLFLHGFFDQELLPFQIGDALLIAGNGGRDRRFHHPIHQLPNLLFNGDQLLPSALQHGASVFGLLVPGILEHRRRQIKQRLCGA
ncbi:MAG: hypothetical protein SFZ03_10160 [Candidatus Melainabacteria bacterium]|nr:hypothetical protein [Candidatus Melainabacteria bacterium]